MDGRTDRNRMPAIAALMHSIKRQKSISRYNYNIILNFQMCTYNAKKTITSKTRVSISIYNHSCRDQHVERPSVPHHICTVTRCLQTASQDSPLLSFLPGHPDMTYLSLLIIIIVFPFSDISHGPCNN